MKLFLKFKLNPQFHLQYDYRFLEKIIKLDTIRSYKSYNYSCLGLCYSMLMSNAHMKIACLYDFAYIVAHIIFHDNLPKTQYKSEVSQVFKDLYALEYGEGILVGNIEIDQSSRNKKLSYLPKNASLESSSLHGYFYVSTSVDDHDQALTSLKNVYLNSISTTERVFKKLAKKGWWTSLTTIEKLNKVPFSLVDKDIQATDLNFRNKLLDRLGDKDYVIETRNLLETYGYDNKISNQKFL